MLLGLYLRQACIEKNNPYLIFLFISIQPKYSNIKWNFFQGLLAHLVEWRLILFWSCGFDFYWSIIIFLLPSSPSVVSHFLPSKGNTSMGSPWFQCSVDSLIHQSIKIFTYPKQYWLVKLIKVTLNMKYHDDFNSTPIKYYRKTLFYGVFLKIMQDRISCTECLITGAFYLSCEKN